MTSENMNSCGTPPVKRTLSVFTLAMMNLAIICTLRALPMMAEEGLSLVFYYVFAALIFLIPVSLVSAELATGWPPQGPGGVYIWVREAFGERIGFLAIWLQWAQNVIWYPTALSFIGATIAYAIDPALASNKFYMMSIILVIYWGGTLASFRGMKTSGLISTVGVIGGVFIPGLFIIALGIVWLVAGNASEVVFTSGDLLPDLTDVNKIVLLAGAILMFSGIEVTAVHSQSVKDPKKVYPRAIFLSSAIAVSMLMLGSLAIAVVVPQKEISLVAGLMEAFKVLLDKFGLKYIVPVVAVFIAVGSLGELCSWIIGPSKGLYITALNGDLPPFMRKINGKGVPVLILALQGVIVTAMSLVFLLMPTVSGSYWILSAMCVILYLIMYLLLYLAAIRLRYSRPGVPRAYAVPGGKPGMWSIAGTGILGAMLGICIGLFPPSQINTGSPVFYEIFLCGGVVLMCAVPFVMIRRKPVSGDV